MHIENETFLDRHGQRARRDPVMVLSGEHLDRDELGTLYTIARVLNSTLELDEVLQMVMDRVIEVVNADRGFLMLVNRETSLLEFNIARNNREHTLKKTEFEQISLSTVNQVVCTQKAVTDADRFDPTLSMQAYGIRSLMCAPLVVREMCIGAVYVDRRTTMGLFTSKHRALLLAFCHQAAIAIDNARLFADLNQAMRKVNEDKQYRDNIFASIANGVITTNSAGIITMFNARAGLILNLNPQMALGKHYKKVFHIRPQVGLSELLHNTQVEHEHGTIVPNSVVCNIPGRRGLVYLNLYVSSLRDTQGMPIGMALVVDDRTELKHKEDEAKEIRRLFTRYVHPRVVEQLIKNPQALKLGGETKEITIVFADIREYSRLSENLAPEEVMNLLNAYLKIMVEKIWEEEGTITAFMGDALMAIFNAPLPQKAHALKAVRATWNMRQAVLDYKRSRPQDTSISFGFGVNTGLAVVGNLGSEERIQNYTAIGDAVNVANRLQSNAADNNILLNDSTCLQVYRHVQLGQPFSLDVKNKTERLKVRYLLGLN
jgi:adenylate cyclase